jgi:hypothetical protein
MKEIPKDYEREKKADIVSTVYEADESKALTGRTPERIEEETGVPKEEMFPNEKKILYVGDPWQRMGKEIDSSNFTLIDYEFGEVARFESDDWQLRRELPYGKEKLDERAEGLLCLVFPKKLKTGLMDFGNLMIVLIN